MAISMTTHSPLLVRLRPGEGIRPGPGLSSWFNGRGEGSPSPEVLTRFRAGDGRDLGSSGRRLLRGVGFVRRRASGCPEEFLSWRPALGESNSANPALHPWRSHLP